jgi:nitrate/nitrite transport system substrate-binding protein
MAHAFITGSDRPEKTVIRAGFMPLTDCASLVMASVLGLDDKYGIKLELARQHSWSGMRDRLLQGEIDAAHVLYGLLYGVENGIGTAPTRMAVLMNLSRNGQAITLSRALASQGVTDLGTLAAAMRKGTRRFTFAHTFPTGNHAMLLYYWLAAGGIDPVRDAQVVTVPPSQMAVNLAAGHMDGFCAGEPWSARAQLDGSGFTVATSQDIWPDHPGKALGLRRRKSARVPLADRGRAGSGALARRVGRESRRGGRGAVQSRLRERRPPGHRRAPAWRI